MSATAKASYHHLQTSLPRCHWAHFCCPWRSECGQCTDLDGCRRGWVRCLIVRRSMLTLVCSPYWQCFMVWYGNWTRAARCCNGHRTITAVAIMGSYYMQPAPGRPTDEPWSDGTGQRGDGKVAASAMRGKGMDHSFGFIFGSGNWSACTE